MARSRDIKGMRIRKSQEAKAITKMLALGKKEARSQ